MAKFYQLTRKEKLKSEDYYSCIVVADTEEEARKIHPKATYPGDDWWFSTAWCSKTQTHLLDVEELGLAYDHLKPGTVILASQV